MKPEEMKMVILTKQRKRANQKSRKSKNEQKSASSSEFDGKCNYCSKRGHKED